MGHGAWVYALWKLRGEVSVTAGSLFEGTRKPLRDWFFAIWFVTSQKHGASALGLQRVLALGSYQTAWTWLHKIRRAMVRPGRERLSGTVEIDETFIGAPEEDHRWMAGIFWVGASWPCEKCQIT